MNTADFHSFLYGRTDFEKRRLTADFKESFSLDLMYKILEHTGMMQKLPPALHVAGTNGKGSVCFFLEQGLLSGGATTGTFLSPHVERVHERIRINGAPVADPLLMDAAERILALSLPEIEQATTFEILFLLAVDIFAASAVDYCIFETGLGGRLDTTNVLTPTASVITSVSMDHTAILGDTLEKIAYEKAGIIKSGIPCFIAPQKRDAATPIRQRCRATGSPLTITNRDDYTITDRGILGFGYNSPVGHIECRMGGRHQPENLHLAMRVLQQLQLPLDIPVLSERLKNNSLPARTEYVADRPAYLLDGGHNPAAAEALYNLLGACRKELLFITALQEDKDYPSYLTTIGKLPGRFFFTGTGSDRSATGEQLAAILPDRGAPYPDPFSALNAARAQASRDSLIIISGSFYLCGILRKTIRMHD